MDWDAYLRVVVRAALASVRAPSGASVDALTVSFLHAPRSVLGCVNKRASVCPQPAASLRPPLRFTWRLYLACASFSSHFVFFWLSYNMHNDNTIPIASGRLLASDSGAVTEKGDPRLLRVPQLRPRERPPQSLGDRQMRRDAGRGAGLWGERWRVRLSSHAAPHEKRPPVSA